MMKKNKKPWPTKKAMEQVYEMKLWGENHSQFFSGDGSHNPKIVAPYVNTVKSFLRSFKNPITVCDLGCGDFNIGKQLVEFTKKYIAVDIVENLISFNNENYKASNLEFQCLDIAVDELPIADCAIIRQVLQHLSNSEIQNIVKNLKQFKYIILTEHIPKGDFTANIDVISGQGIRLKKQSGVNLLEPPFNLKVKTEIELLSIDLKENKGVIQTTLYEI